MHYTFPSIDYSQHSSLLVCNGALVNDKTRITLKIMNEVCTVLRHRWLFNHIWIIQITHVNSAINFIGISRIWKAVIVEAKQKMVFQQTSFSILLRRQIIYAWNKWNIGFVSQEYVSTQSSHINSYTNYILVSS